MRIILFVLLSFALTCSEAHTYYFSANSGDDNRNGVEAQNPSTPWKTLSKLNSLFKILKPGDAVLFKRDEVFYGSITISESGTSAEPITIGAYGRGARPVITGLKRITEWASAGGGIYEKQDYSFSDNLNRVLFNDNVQPLGRWPKANAPRNGYLTNFKGGSTSIQSKEIANAPNFAGGEIVMRKYQWILDRALVVSQNKTTINYSSFVSPGHPGFTYDAFNGHGFFFQNHINALTTLGDWCYERATKKIKMYFGNKNPQWFNIKASTQETLVDIIRANYIVFDNISFTGANSNTFNISSSHYIKINNCDINFSGVNAINVTNSSSANIAVTNSRITNTNNNAINANNSTNWIIQNNIIRNTGMIRGMGVSGDAQYNAIQNISSNSLVEYNEIINTGYIGIHFIGDHTIIKNNHIDSFCMVKSDGGGIYTNGETGVDRKIIGNIVSNGIGDLYGIDAEINNPAAGQVHGIYMDGNSNNVTIKDNTCFGNAHSGLFFGSCTNMYATNNLLYNNKAAQLKGLDSKALLSNVNIKNNILVARDSAQLVVSFVLKGLYNIGSVDYNYYCHPIYEPKGIKTSGYPHVPTFFNYPGGGIAEGYNNKFFSLDTWQTLTGWDAHTVKTPVTINDLRKLRFEYNATKKNKAIYLDGTYVDVKNKLYSNTISLAPFTSIILLKRAGRV